jgi:predicted PurR-regulated permease PerM
MEEGVTEATTRALPERDRMPAWLPKGIALFWIGFILVEVVEGIVGALRALLVTLLVSLFLSFAIEPAVNFLARRGWRRGGATAAVFVVLVAILALFVFAIGSLVVSQVRNFVDDAPEYVEDLEDWINDTFDANVDFDDLSEEFDDPEGPVRQFVEDLAGNALKAGLTAIEVVFQILTIALFTFYLVADGPRLRRTICSVLPPRRQEFVLRAWELAIEKTGGYLYSRLILAGLSTAFHWVILSIMGVPYALALALWVGVVSQFIPVVGTYLAGALAVLVAVLNEPLDGAVVLGFVVVYQQIENYLFAPRVTAHTMSLHPAVAFASVIAGAALLGPIGALLALPAAAVLQAFASTFGERHEVVESELTAERPAKRARRQRRER